MNELEQGPFGYEAVRLRELLAIVPTEHLQRVLAKPLESWTFSTSCNSNGQRCLSGQLRESTRDEDQLLDRYPGSVLGLTRNEIWNLEAIFDDTVRHLQYLCEVKDAHAVLPVVVEAVREVIQDILKARGKTCP